MRLYNVPIDVMLNVYFMGNVSSGQFCNETVLQNEISLINTLNSLLSFNPELCNPLPLTSFTFRDSSIIFYSQFFNDAVSTSRCSVK
jgi:hypothetical protein